MPTCQSPSTPGGGSAIAGPETLSRFVSLHGLTTMPVGAARRVNDREAAIMFGEVEPVFAVEQRELPGPGGAIRIRVYRPSAAPSLPALVYFHGGGWVVGSLDSHDGVTRHLCAHGGCIVVAVDYRLAPEHRFPAALEDAWAATEWVRTHAHTFGADPARLAVGGDSTGGNLAAVVALRARDRRLPLKLQLLVYPVLDCGGDAAGDGTGAFGWWVDRYLRTRADGLSPDASPIRAGHLRGVAPVFLQSCGADLLRHEARAYEHRLHEAGVAVEHVQYPGLIHGAYRMPAVLDGARQMLDDSAGAVAKAFAPA